MRGALGPDRQLYSGAFPLGGAISTVTVGANWSELDPDGADLVAVHVPAGTRQVRMRSSESDLTGAAATEAEMSASFPMPAGIYEFCTDRSGDSPRFYLAIDPTDGSDLATSADVVVMRAGG